MSAGIVSLTGGSGWTGGFSRHDEETVTKATSWSVSGSVSEAKTLSDALSLPRGYYVNFFAHVAVDETTVNITKYPDESPRDGFPDGPKFTGDIIQRKANSMALHHELHPL